MCFHVSAVSRQSTSSPGERRSSSGCIAARDRSASAIKSPESEYHSPRPLASQSIDNAGLAARRAMMLQRQNATTEDPDSFLHEHCTSPRPPSQPRPRSAKGRPRSGSRPRSSSAIIARPTSESPTRSLPQSPVSFSKYKPLPSINSSSSLISCSSTGSQSYDNINIGHHDTNQLTENMTNISLKQNKKPPTEPPESESHRIHLAVKMLDGSRHERWFRLSDTIGDILCYAESVTDETLPENCEICTNELPKRVFSDLSLTLEDAGLPSRTVLYIQER